MIYNVLLQKNGMTAFPLAITQIIIPPLKCAFWRQKLSTETGQRFSFMPNLTAQTGRARCLQSD